MEGVPAMPDVYQKAKRALGIKEGGALDQQIQEEVIDQLADSALADLKVRAGVHEEPPREDLG